MSNKTRNRTEMMSITEYHNWDVESKVVLEYCKKNLVDVLKKIDDGVVVKMKSPYDRRRKNEVYRKDIERHLVRIRHSLKRVNKVGMETIETYNKYRTTYKDEKTGFVFPNQDIMNGDLDLEWSIPIPSNRLQKGLGIDLYEGLEGDDDFDKRWELKEHIEHLMYSGLSKYVIPTDEKLENKMKKFVDLYVEIFEESLVYNEDYKNFIIDNIKSKKEMMKELETKTTTTTNKIGHK